LRVVIAKRVFMSSVIGPKAISFAIRVVHTSRLLMDVNKEFVLSKQLLRSGTAIGALVREAEHAESPSDFLHKMNIALKEANETDYWLMLLAETNYLTNEAYGPLKDDCQEIIRILASIVKTMKQKLGREVS
jgi:four helix bundle protein